MDLKEYAANNHVPIIKDGGLDFIIALIKKTDCKMILELGSAIGYSAIKMAKTAADIYIDTLEKNEAMYLKAKENIAKAALNDRISIYHTDIKDFKTDKLYDLIFVDAAKAQYYNYLNQFIDNLKEDGVMVFDNIAFHGMVKDPSLTKNRNTKALVKKIRKFKELVQEDDRFDIMIYEDIGDGILTLRRRKNRWN